MKCIRLSISCTRYRIGFHASYGARCLLQNLQSKVIVTSSTPEVIVTSSKPEVLVIQNLL